MKILVISNINSPKRMIVDDFEELGHEAEVFLCRPYSRGDFRGKLTEKMPGYTSISKKISKIIVNRQLKEKISEFQPDLIIGDKAEMIDPETLEDVEAEKVLWFPDDPQLHSLGKKLSQGYDKVLTNSKCVLESYDIDARLFPFPMADKNLYGEREKKYNICFIGRCDEKRKRYMKVVAENFEDVFIGGPEWDNEIKYAEVENRWISEEEMIRKFEESQIVINLAKTREHITHRLFEAGAAQSTVLTERLSGLRKFYSGEEMPSFEDPEEMCEQIQDLLENSEKRKDTISSSRKTTINTYARNNLAEEIIDLADLAQLETQESSNKSF